MQIHMNISWLLYTLDVYFHLNERKILRIIVGPVYDKKIGVICKTKKKKLQGLFQVRIILMMIIGGR